MIADYAGAILGFVRRGSRMARSNPQLFRRRLGLFMRTPIRTGVALLDSARSRERIQQSYSHWIGCRTPQAAPATSESVDAPLLSIIMPVFNTDVTALREAIRSVTVNSYQKWELCIADDASTDPHVRPVLDEAAASDSRVRVAYRDRQGHISAASNTALNDAAGEFIVLLDHDDCLTVDALWEVARVIQSHPDVDFIYSDEDKLQPDGTRAEPFFKPAWSPTLLTAGNYVTHLAAMRKTLVNEVGGFRDETVGSQDYDLFLRVLERSRAVAHIPNVLYSWRKSSASTAAGSGAKPYAIEATHRLLTDMVERRQLDRLGAFVRPSHLNGLFSVRYSLNVRPSVSLVITGRSDYWKAGLNESTVQVCEVTRISSPDDPIGLNSAESVQNGAGSFIFWVDSSSRAADAGSVSALLEYAQLAHVAAVGGRTSDAHVGSILQAGIIIGDEGQPRYAYAGLSPFPHPNFYLNLKDLPREVSAVHSGCCVFRRDVWQHLGGIRADLPPSLAIHDLCLRAGKAGFDVVYMPLARFKSTVALPVLPDVARYDWPWKKFSDPFWNPNLSPDSPYGLPFRHHGQREARVRSAGTRCRD
jgi:O-antigen biosynthesis protein